MPPKESHLVILGSARKDSNTLKAVLKTLPNNDFTLVELLDYALRPYDYDHSKLKSDRFPEIVDQMLNAQTITFATPVYWYAMSGQMKTFFDRFTELLSTYKPKGKALAGKDVYLVAVGASAEIPEGFELPFRKTAEYFKMNFKKTFYFSI